jgi:hypothetical protein
MDQDQFSKSTFIPEYDSENREKSDEGESPSRDGTWHYVIVQLNAQGRCEFVEHVYTLKAEEQSDASGPCCDSAKLRS